MFAPYCEAHGSRVLLPSTAITALISTDDGIIARFTCICGHPGTWQANRSDETQVTLTVV